VVDEAGEGAPWTEAGRAVPSDDEDAGAAVAAARCGSVVDVVVLLLALALEDSAAAASAAFSSSDNIVFATLVMSFISEISPICFIWLVEATVGAEEKRNVVHEPLAAKDVREELCGVLHAWATLLADHLLAVLVVDGTEVGI